MRESFKAFAARVNALIDEKRITLDEYRLLWRAYEDKLRAEAVAKAKFKFGDRVSGRRHNIEITEIVAVETSPGEYAVRYWGKKIDRYGRCVKAKLYMPLPENGLEPFIPKPLPFERPSDNKKRKED